MGPLEAFLATWTQARQTYGQDSPVGGSPFDGSAKLRSLQADVNSAAPGTHWSGGAADTYAARNAEHAQVLGKLADLDAQLAAEIDESAKIVASGRAELDRLRAWVVSAASSVPENPAGEAMAMAIVAKGMRQLTEVMVRSDGELNAVGARIQQIGAQYSALGFQKFAP